MQFKENIGSKIFMCPKSHRLSPQIAKLRIILYVYRYLYSVKYHYWNSIHPHQSSQYNKKDKYYALIQNPI